MKNHLFVTTYLYKAFKPYTFIKRHMKSGGGKDPKKFGALIPHSLNNTPKPPPGNLNILLKNKKMLNLKM